MRGMALAGLRLLLSVAAICFALIAMIYTIATLYAWSNYVGGCTGSIDCINLNRLLLLSMVVVIPWLVFIALIVWSRAKLEPQFGAETTR